MNIDRARQRLADGQLPQLDDWRCYRCGRWRRASHPHTVQEVQLPMGGMAVRVCAPACDPEEETDG